MNRLPYDLADQRSHIGGMATIATIVIRVISLLVKRNDCVLVVGGGKITLDVFFPAKKARNACWEVVCGIFFCNVASARPPMRTNLYY